MIKRSSARRAKTGFVMHTMLFCRIAVTALIVAAVSGSANAQQTPGTPGVITGGSNGVAFNGKPAARQGDATSDGSVIVEGSPNVFINGKPAAISSGKTGCGGVVVGGAGGIYINGKPAARTGDQTSGCK